MAVLVLSCCLLFCCSGALRGDLISTPAPKTTMYLSDQNSHLRLEKPSSRQTEIGQEFPRKPVWAGGDAFDWQQPRGNRTEQNCIYCCKVLLRCRYNESSYHSSWTADDQQKYSTGSGHINRNTFRIVRKQKLFSFRKLVQLMHE